MAKNVVFDEDSASRIAAAVKWVEQYSTAEEPPPDETETTEPRRIIRGTFTGVWAKGATLAVDFTADNGDTKTKQATNYFSAVGLANQSNACVIALIGSEWVLVSADPASSSECVEVVTALVDFPGQIVTDVSCVNGNLVVTTAEIAVTTQEINLPPQTGCN